MSEANNSERADNIEIELENEYQPVEDIMSLIKKQTSGITIKSDDIKNLTKILKEWNDCYLFKEEPKKELEEIKIDDFTLSYEEFKGLLNNGLLSNQYYPNYHISDPNEQEAILDRMMPSMSKDGIFNMMNYNLAKHSSISDKVELHYASINRYNIHSILFGLYNLINNKIVEESKTDGKVHFILTDAILTGVVKAKDKIDSGHVTPFIVMNGEVFEFDSIGELEIESEYHTKYLQQSDSTSCKTIAIREVDNFLKMLEDFNSIEKFSSYLKQFFSENKIEYYIDPVDPDTGDLIEGPKETEDEKELKRNKRLAILPFPILKNSQSLSSLKKTLEFIQNLEKKQEDLPETEKEEFIKKYKHILEMKDKLDKLIKRFEVEKKISKDETASVSAYTLKERLRQAKVLAILLEKGKIKSLKNVEEYNKSVKNGKVAVATVDKELVKEINNKTEGNIKNKKSRISKNNELNIEKEKMGNKNLDEEQKVDTENYNSDIEPKLEKKEKAEEQDKKNEISDEEEINKNNEKIEKLRSELEIEGEKTKSTIIYKIFNFFSRIFLGRETTYKTKQEILLEKEILINRIFREQFHTVSGVTEQEVSNQNKLIQQNIRNEFDNTIDIRVRNK